MTDPTGQRVSETAKCAEERECLNGTVWCCRLSGHPGSHWWVTYNPHEPAEPVAVPQAPEPTLDELCLCVEKTHDGFHDDKCPILVPAVPQAPTVEMPTRPRMESATRGCGAVYLVSEVEAYIARVETYIRALEGKRA